MRLLFVCDDFFPEPNASSSLIHNIIACFEKKNISCDVLNISSHFWLQKTVFWNGKNIYNETNFYRVSIDEAKGVKKAFCAIYKCFDRIYDYRIKKNVSSKIERRLMSIFKQQNYDFIIPVVSDFNNGNGVVAFCKKHAKNYILYQTDPIGSNFTQNKYRRKLESFEKTLYEGASLVITTPIIAKEKKNNKDYDSKRILPLEFPNVVPQGTSTIDSDKIIFTFSGHLIKGVRDCSYGLSLLSRLDMPSIFVNIIGSGQEEIIEQYSASSLKNKISRMGVKSKSECDKYIKESHFLINFDNALPNQVPSKIFDYISTGRPIINFCRSANSPTIKYLERYGLFLNIIEPNDLVVRSEEIKKISLFISQNINIQKSSSEILRDFAKNTPEYVSQEIINAINKLLGR